MSYQSKFSVQRNIVLLTYVGKNEPSSYANIPCIIHQKNRNWENKNCMNDRSLIVFIFIQTLLIIGCIYDKMCQSDTRCTLEARIACLACFAHLIEFRVVENTASSTLVVSIWFHPFSKSILIVQNCTWHKVYYLSQFSMRYFFCSVCLQQQQTKPQSMPVGWPRHLNKIPT